MKKYSTNFKRWWAGFLIGFSPMSCTVPKEPVPDPFNKTTCYILADDEI